MGHDLLAVHALGDLRGLWLRHLSETALPVPKAEVSGPILW